MSVAKILKNAHRKTYVKVVGRKKISLGFRVECDKEGNILTDENGNQIMVEVFHEKPVKMIKKEGRMSLKKFALHCCSRDFADKELQFAAQQWLKAKRIL